jgi:MtN3 and saliva related transmembrane protein
MLVSIIGTTAAILGVFGIIPQVVKTVKSCHTKDLSLLWLITAGSGIALWTLYGILQGDLLIAVGNGFLLFMVCILLRYKIKYG